MFPVAVTNISALEANSSIVVTSYPSMLACSAQIGSISVTTTLAPCERKDSADPFPTSPNPQTTAVFPASITSVALFIPSTKLSLHPYRLSNFDLVTESLTFIAGTPNEPSFSIS